MINNSKDKIEKEKRNVMKKRRGDRRWYIRRRKTSRIRRLKNRFKINKDGLDEKTPRDGLDYRKRRNRNGLDEKKQGWIS